LIIIQLCEPAEQLCWLPPRRSALCRLGVKSRKSDFARGLPRLAVGLADEQTGGWGMESCHACCGTRPKTLCTVHHSLPVAARRPYPAEHAAANSAPSLFRCIKQTCQNPPPSPHSHWAAASCTVLPLLHCRLRGSPFKHSCVLPGGTRQRKPCRIAGPSMHYPSKQFYVLCGFFLYSNKHFALRPISSVGSVTLKSCNVI
jgi:hypothetical protein